MHIKQVPLWLLKQFVRLLRAIADAFGSPESAAATARRTGGAAAPAPAAWLAQVQALDERTRALDEDSDALAIADALQLAVLALEEIRSFVLSMDRDNDRATQALNFLRLILQFVFQIYLRDGDSKVLTLVLPLLVILDRRMAEACSDATYEERILRWGAATGLAIADGDRDGTLDRAEGIAALASLGLLIGSFVWKGLLTPKAPWGVTLPDGWSPVFRAGFDDPAQDWPEPERRALQHAFTTWFPPAHPPLMDRAAFLVMPSAPRPWQANGAAVTILPVPARQPLHDGGVAISVEGDLRGEVTSDDGRETMSLEIDPGFAVVIPVGSPPLVRAAPALRMRGAYVYRRPPAAADDAPGAGLRLDELRVEAGIEGGAQDLSFQVLLALRGLQLAVGGPLPLRGRTDLVLRYDTRSNRIQFEGGLGLELRKRFSLGNVEDADAKPTGNPVAEATLLARLAAAAREDGYEFKAELLVDATLRLSRFAALSVAGAGLRFALRNASEGGGQLLGLADAGVDDVLPSGIGIAITAGPIQGGGMLRVTPERVSGVVELALGRKFRLTGVGQFASRRRWLVLVTLEIPSSSPFVPRAIGLLLARGRQADANALRAAVGTGELALVLTPRDVVVNEGRILAALDRFFPPGEGWLIGAMARFESKGGTFSASIGVLAELPDDDCAPIELHLLAVAQVKVPSQPPWALDGVGLWVLGRGEGYLFLKLRDARLWGVELTGSALVYHGDPDGDGPVGKGTWISLGGFYPGYAAPGPALQGMTRLGLTWRDGEKVSLSLTGYLAWTPSSLQFGIGAKFKASYSGFGFDGELSFDALVAFDWSCQIDFHAHLRFKVLGRTLAGFGVDCTYSATDHYRLCGAAHYEFLCFSGTKHFHCDLGERDGPRLPVSQVEQALADALRQPSAWRLPAVPGVVLAERERGIVLPPDGRTHFEQDIVPLDVTIELFGAQRLARPRAFAIQVEGVAGAPQRSTRLGEFAPGLYFDLSEDEALRAPVAVQHDNGFELQWPLHAGAACDVVEDWEEIIVDPGYAPPRPPPGPRLPGHGLLLRGELLSGAFVAAPAPPPVVVRPAVFRSEGLVPVGWMRAWAGSKGELLGSTAPEPGLGGGVFAPLVRATLAGRAVLTEVWR